MTETFTEIIHREFNDEVPDLLAHIMEHEAVGGGRVIDAERARSTPCKCFEHEGETYAWSPGILGLISGKKNPDQLEEFCNLGCEPAGEGLKERFSRVKTAVQEAHKEWMEEGGEENLQELTQKSI